MKFTITVYLQFFSLKLYLYMCNGFNIFQGFYSHHSWDPGEKKTIIQVPVREHKDKRELLCIVLGARRKFFMDLNVTMQRMLTSTWHLSVYCLVDMIKFMFWWSYAIKKVGWHSWLIFLRALEEGEQETTISHNFLMKLIIWGIWKGHIYTGNYILTWCYIEIN